MNDNLTPPRLLQRVRYFVSGVELVAHDLLTPSIWRVALTIVSFVTTTYGLMLLYDTLGVGDHGKGSIGFLRFLIPISVAGALHAAIFYLLTQWATTARAKYFRGALPLQVIAILASFGTHWVHMMGGSATMGQFQTTLDSEQRSIGAFVASYDTIADETVALAAHSNVQATVEKSGGGSSCGMVAGNGKGPRYELRMNDQATFAAFDSEIRPRKAQVDDFAKRAEALTARSADEAMAQLATLRVLVNEAKAHLENDSLLDQIRKVAEARVVTGKGPIDIPPALRGKSGEKQFACYDAVLEQRLNAVIAAIKNLKPLPEVIVSDLRDPNTGFPYALGRLVHMFRSLTFSPPSRANLSAERVRTLEVGTAANQDTASWHDVMPLAVASAIEMFLALLFYIGRDRFARHPGMTELANLLRRRDVAIFDRIWQSLGGGGESEAVRRTIDAWSKFEGKYNWVFVPLYSEDDDARLLHTVMEMLVEANLARRAFTGRGLMARWYMNGWCPARRARVSKQPVAIYRMTASEYMAFVLDALARKDANDLGDEPHSGNENRPDSSDRGILIEDKSNAA